MRGNYGASLRRARVQAGLSQRQLAEKLGVDRVHVVRIETGSIKMPKEDLRACYGLQEVKPSHARVPRH